jgi:hypothetical protein
LSILAWRGEFFDKSSNDARRYFPIPCSFGETTLSPKIHLLLLLKFPRFLLARLEPGVVPPCAALYHAQADVPEKVDEKKDVSVPQLVGSYRDW